MFYTAVAIMATVPFADTVAKLGLVERSTSWTMLCPMVLLVAALDALLGFGLSHCLLLVYAFAYAFLAMWYGESAESQDFIWNPTRFFAFPFLFMELLLLFF